MLSLAARDFFFWFVVPLWLAAGLADWHFHRRTRIEHTSGVPESLLHLLMLVEVGVPALAAVFLQLNALVLLLVLAGLLTHTATTWADLRYTHPRRHIGPDEQMVHALLVVLPGVAASFAVVFAWPQAQALFGLGDAAADFAPRLRETKAFPDGLAVVLPVAAAVVGAAFVEELWRTLRAPRPTS